MRVRVSEPLTLQQEWQRSSRKMERGSSQLLAMQLTEQLATLVSVSVLAQQAYSTH